MPTVLRREGFRFVVYPDDHDPPHIHAIGDGEAKIILAGADGGAELVYALGMSRGDVRRVMRIVGEEGERLLAGWKAVHG